MTYHTNHSFCTNSIWNNKLFDSEAMVYFGKNITKTDLLEDDKNNFNFIRNPDFDRLTEENEYFDQVAYDFQIETLTRIFPEKKEEILTNVNKDIFFKKIYKLKEEVFNWLEENIKDVETDSTDINDVKGWCIGNDDFLIQDMERITIFFKRQLDALNFIRTYSIFKEPVFYFDYFGEDRRNMDFNKYFFILNTYLKDNNLELLNKEDFDFKNKEQGNINLDPFSFYLLDWEKDDIYLDDIEKAIFLNKLYDNKDISYENNNIHMYPKVFELENTNDIKKLII